MSNQYNSSLVEEAIRILNSNGQVGIGVSAGVGGPVHFRSTPEAVQYRTELMFADLDNSNRPRTARRSSSTTTASTSDDSVFDESASYVESEYSTALTTISSRSYLENVNFVVGNMPINDPHGLPCEFAGYSGCDANFPLDDFDSWFDHIVGHHLRNELPAKCLCWFCDEIVFFAKDHRDRRTNFVKRMEHIHNHFIDHGDTLEQVRPDYHILDHFLLHRLVSEEMNRRARGYDEGNVPYVADIHPHDFVPPPRTRSSQEPWPVEHISRRDTQQGSARVGQRSRQEPRFRSNYFSASRTSTSNRQER
ncbi:putative C2H2-type domain-containing protein [Seiridium cardinale]|uniref:C2H2-type domain-containing protein n=1 Tax=Seiridium cardinale TaxID=138064 RepID=A0ABR2XYU9_9PEZI